MIWNPYKTIATLCGTNLHVILYELVELKTIFLVLCKCALDSCIQGLNLLAGFGSKDG